VIYIIGVMEAAIIGFIDIKYKNALKLIFTNMNTCDISTYKGIFVIQYAESHIFVITAGGRFASPVGTPYDSRFLVPGTKETFPYCIYEVVEPLEVKAAVVAEWFGKPGGGIQYALEKDMDFQKLLDRGIIREVN